MATAYGFEPSHFNCGHPRTRENSYQRASGYSVCACCERIRNICRRAERDQRRINAGTFYTIGEKIARGIA